MRSGLLDPCFKTGSMASFLISKQVHAHSRLPVATQQILASLPSHMSVVRATSHTSSERRQHSQTTTVQTLLSGRRAFTGPSLRTWPLPTGMGLSGYSKRLSDALQDKSSRRATANKVHTSSSSLHCQARFAGVACPQAATSQSTEVAQIASHFRGLPYPCRHPSLQVLLTLFPKAFSPFDRSTCALSVLQSCSVLAEKHLSIRAPVPRRSTL